MLKIFIALSYFVSTIGFASQRKAIIPVVFDPTFVAERSASFLNEVKNWETLIKLIEETSGKNQALAIRNLLKSKIDLNSRFPKFTAKGNKIVFGGQSLVINKDQTFNYHGLVFHKPEQALDFYIQDCLERFTPISWFSYFIEAAEAAPTFNSQEASYGAVLAALAAVGMVSLMIGTGPLLAAAGIAAAIAGTAGLAVLIGVNLWQKMKRGEVECRGSEFYVRYRPDNSLTTEASAMPHEEPLYPKDKEGKPLPCTPARAKTLEDLFSYQPSYVDKVESQPSNPGASQ